jgi:enoyl-CoA hydratase/carnithine racemase
MPLLYEKKGKVGWLTLSRPDARNCWGEDFNEEILRLCDELSFDDGVAAIVLTGDPAGEAFSAGANLADRNTHRVTSTADFIHNLPRRRLFAGQALSEFAKPVIAGVNGYAIGVGSIVTTCCDLIVASDKAEWRLPQAALGIIPNHAGSTRLARWIGKGNAMKVALGFPLKADEAHRLGLAQWLVPHAEFEERLAEIADKIASLPPLASRLVKESMNRGYDASTIAEAGHMDLYRAMALSMTPESHEKHEDWRKTRKKE